MSRAGPCSLVALLCAGLSTGVAAQGEGRSDAEAVQTAIDTLPHRIQPDVVDEDVHEVMDTDGARVPEVVLFQREVDVLGQVRIPLQGGVGEVHVLEATAARRDEVEAVPLGDGQVPGAERLGQELVDV